MTWAVLETLSAQLQASPRQVVLLRGPAGSGKTRAILELYRRLPRPTGKPACILLAPNAATADHLRRTLLNDAPAGVLVSPQILTFNGLAGRIISAARIGGKALSGFQRHLLLRKIVDDLLREGQLSSITNVAETRGLLVALDRAIAELKRAAIEPQSLQKVLPPRPDKRHDLLKVYQRYQHHLHENEAYDIEGLMWKARQVLLETAHGGPAHLPEIDAILADGFTDFTPTQLQILKLLHSAGKSLLITLPYAEDRRERLWRWSQHTLDRVRRTFGKNLREISLHRRNRSPIAPLCERLFDFDAEPCEPPRNLHLVAAAGVEAEVTAVARRIKRLLVQEKAGNSIAVVARSLEEYREPIQRIFGEFSIPVAHAAEPLKRVPIVRFALSVASLAPRFLYRDVLRVINNSYFRPASLGPYDETTVVAAQVLIREGNVLEGREAYKAAAERLVLQARCRKIDDESLEEEDGRPNLTQAGGQKLKQAAEMLERLFELSLPSAGESPSASQTILRCIDKLQLWQVACEEESRDVVGRDLRALEALVDALRQPAAERLAMTELLDALEELICPPGRSEGLVTVLDAMEGRAMRFDHVFLLGVSEGRFPAPQMESSLLCEADRAAWSSRGLELYRRSDLIAREMFLFYLAVSRADHTLTISYLESGESGRPAAPSSFLLSLLSPCGGLEALRQAGRLERIPPGRFAAAVEGLACENEALVAAMAGLFGTEPIDYRRPLGWVVANTFERLRRACAGIWARHRRWLPGPCNEFDGKITDPRLLRLLTERYPRGNVFSATQLNSYAQCPWQFFARYVLKLEPLAEPTRRLEAVSRGLFCHNVLARVMSRLRSEQGGPVRLSQTSKETLRTVLKEAVEAESAATDALRLPYQELWRVQKARMQQELEDYLLQRCAGDPLDSESLYFELSFGMEIDPQKASDPRSGPAPVTLKTPAGEVSFRGKIDRIDRVRLGNRTGLLVIDYKTGRLPSLSDIKAGRNLQLPLYTYAARFILGEEAFGGAFHRIGGRTNESTNERLWGTLRRRNRMYSLEEKNDSEQQRALAENVGRLVAGMAAGRFNVLPTGRCPAYCPFRQICHFAPARRKVKSENGQEERW